MTQSPTDNYSLLTQQLILVIVLHADTTVPLDISSLKLNVAEYVAKVTSDDVYDQVRDELKAKCSPEKPAPVVEKKPEVPAEPPVEEKKTRAEKKAEKSAEKEAEKDAKEAEEAKT